MRRLYTLLLIVGCILGIKPVLWAQVRTKVQDIDLLPRKGARTLSPITNKYGGEPGEGQAINYSGSRRYLNDTTGRFSAQRRDLVAYIQAVIKKQKDLTLSRGGLEEAIKVLEEDINGSVLIVKQVLLLLLAERYDFLAKFYIYEKYEHWSEERKDSLATLYHKKVMNLYDEALSGEATKQVPISRVQDLFLYIKPYSKSASLYDYIAWQKLEYLIHLKTDKEVAEQKLGIVDSMAFASAEVFSTHVFKQDTASPAMYEIVSLLQDLTRLYLNTTNTVMLEDIDLRRVQLMYQYGKMSNRDELYVKAIKREMHLHEHDTVYAEWGHLLAEYHYRLGQTYSNNRKYSPYKQEIKVAYDMANTILAKYPNSLGAEFCKDLLDAIKSVELNVQIEAINPLNTPILAHIAYQNIPVLYHRLLYVPENRIGLAKREDEDGDTTGILKKKLINELELVASWKNELSQDEDFQPHNIEVRINPLKKAGIYMLVSSVSPDFSIDTLTEYIKFEVSNIAYGYCDNDGQLDVNVFDRLSGMPISNVKVSTYSEASRHKGLYNEIDTMTATVHTNDNGQAVHKESDLGLRFSKAKDYLKITDDEVNIRTDKIGTCDAPQFNFILDKATYLPKEILHFKGWITAIDDNGQTCKDIFNKRYEIGLYNGISEIRNIVIEPNEYGAFEGSILLSSIHLNGEMSIKVSYYYTNSIGGAFKVEGLSEPISPRFIVTTDITDKTYALDDIVTIRGIVKSTDNSPISKLSADYIVSQKQIYRVKSTGLWREGRERQVMGLEELSIAPDGSFNLRISISRGDIVEACIDLSLIYRIEICISDESYHDYCYHHTIEAKPNPSLLDLDILPIQDINDLHPIRLISRNISNESGKQNGTLLIEELVAPLQALRKRAWKAIRDYGRTSSFIEHPTMSSSAFGSSFPNMAYDDEDEDMANWPIKCIVSKNDLSVKFGTPIALNNRGLEANSVYRISFKYLDTKGDTITVVKYLSCCDLQKRLIPSTVPLWLVSDKPSYAPYEQATIYLGTAFKDAYVFYSIEQDKRIILKDVLKVNTLGKIEIPVRLVKGNYFVVHAMLTKDGRTYISQLTIEVPFTRAHLKMDVGVVNNQLFLKQGNQYCMSIESTPTNVGLCQLLTSIYNASLDVFVTDKWRNLSPKLKSPQLVWVYDTTRVNQPYRFSSKGRYYHYYWYEGPNRSYPYIKEYFIRSLLHSDRHIYNLRFRFFKGLDYEDGYVD